MIPAGATEQVSTGAAVDLTAPPVGLETDLEVWKDEMVVFLLFRKNIEYSWRF